VVAIGTALVAVTAVAASLLAFGPGAPLAQEPAPPVGGSPSPGPVAEDPVLVDLDGEHVSLRYPEGWTVAGPGTDSSSQVGEVVVFRTITAPGGEHRFCFTVDGTDGDGVTSREQQEEWEAGLPDADGLSDVRRIALEEDGTAPPGQDTTRLELTYTNTRWDEPERWVVWQYTVIEEEGRGYLVQADIPAADLDAYGDVVNAVLDSFEPVL